ncbi:MAG TPA: hypothetical protein VL225_19965 [Vicinamibacterales bacterium]|nr:hypothetical protein [Vicinamibacterales bacterium]
MVEQNAGAVDRALAPWVVPAVAALVVGRSAVFVLWPQAHFDSDQAVTGLMAKHLSELRAFPVFWYGQTYLLGVEAWLAAPLMRVLGASVVALKLPLLAINVAAAWLLLRIFVRDVGLDSGRAVFASLFFVAAAPATAALLVMANGGNVEPLLYVLLLWICRRRPVWFGLILGVGFLHREFTVYGAAALVALDAVRGTLFTRASMRRYAIALGTATAIWFLFLGLRQISSAAGPGTSVADLSTRLAANNVVQVVGRLCLDVRAIATGTSQIASTHWPELFGLEPEPLTDFGVETVLSQGVRWSALLLTIALGLPAIRLGGLLLSRRTRGAAGCDACAYLVLAALFSVCGYIVGRCGVIDFATMRYELMSVLGAAGLAAWYLRVERSRALLGVWALACAAIFAISLIVHARLLDEYVRQAPVAPKQDLIRALQARHIRYGYADFWVAYYVTFMTRERIILTPEDAVKIRTYNRIVDAHRDQAVRISRQPCAGGEPLTQAFWSCRP